MNELYHVLIIETLSINQFILPYIIGIIYMGGERINYNSFKFIVFARATMTPIIRIITADFIVVELDVRLDFRLLRVWEMAVTIGLVPPPQTPSVSSITRS